MAAQNPVIVIPGITASKLRDEYPTDPELVWGALPWQKKWERVALHPDDLKYEREEPARVAPDQVLGVAYGDLIDELRHDLSPAGDKPTPVFPFPYDWRQPLESAESQLEDFIDEVIDRTRLIKHYHDDDAWSGRPRVDLVGHSMGGLVIAGLLERLGRASRVGRVATLASPFRGSFEAPLQITTGLSSLGEDAKSSRSREVSRLTPALYYMLPSILDALVVAKEIEPSIRLPQYWRLFDPATWQPGVIKTMQEYIRLHGLNRTDRRKQAEGLFGKLLGTARAHRRRIESLELGGAGLTGGVDGWLCIVGVDAKTRVALHVEKKDGNPRFDLSSTERKNKWGKEDKDWTQTGDGTVPYDGARSGFVPVEKIVCLSPDDFGYWEIKDRALTRIAGFHGILPNMNLVQQLVVAHLKGKDGKGLRGRQPPDLPEGKSWAPPLPKLESRGTKTPNDEDS